jgi:nicotinate-nucleotide--dimethylbenzimidazole phosphoribosyltransferase
MQFPNVLGPDTASAEATAARIDELTKPQGSLGAIESLAIRLAAIAPLPEHGYAHKTVLIGAADHGVTAERISMYPAEVTGQMVQAFIGGFAAINAFARAANAEVFVADFGVRAALPTSPQLLPLAVAQGTANFAHWPAMSQPEFQHALRAGQRAIALICERGPIDIIALGDMGIGNTTSAAAVIACITNKPAAKVVGRGTGVDDMGYARKIAVVVKALNRVATENRMMQLAEVGGFEIIGLAGAIIACAERRIPVLLDGVVVAAAALVAKELAPQSVTVMIATHRSVEPGHAVALEALGLEPLFDFKLRLGEATGAALAFGLCDAAARMVTEMKTFEEAGVSTGKDAPPKDAPPK